MSVEQWRPVPGWPGYEASTHGRIVSRRRAAPVVLKPWATAKGYLFVRLRAGDGSGRSLSVHRVVLETWVGPRPDGLERRHLNGDRSDNRLANLAYGLRGDNTDDQVAHGTHHNARKTSCPAGHRYDEANTRVTRGVRHCRACRREHGARYRARARAAAA